MTSPFTDEELARLAKNPQHDISDLARELLQLRQQITPQAGEAEPVAHRSRHEGRWIFSKQMPPPDDGHVWEPLYTAPPRPVAPVWQPIETAPSKELVFAISEGDEIEMVLGETVSSAHYDDGEPLYLGWLPREALPPPPDSPGATEES